VPNHNQLIRPGRNVQEGQEQGAGVALQWNSFDQRVSTAPGARRSVVCATVVRTQTPREAELGFGARYPCAPVERIEVSAYIPGEEHNLQEHSVYWCARPVRTCPRALPHRARQPGHRGVEKRSKVDRSTAPSVPR